MADVDEIRAYVESHPDDHKQRWRLAKKLYSAWDYRSALEHLLALREVWPDQVPVLRYLAATYYRLGKYEEAERELKLALKEHPDEYSLLEQLAKVYEGAGRTDDAIDAWTKVQEIKPSKTAEEALERLGMAMGTMASTMATNVPEMSSHGNETVMMCPHCGESNDVFSKRCSRCHGDFAPEEKSVSPPEEEPLPHAGRAGVVFALSFIVVAGAAVAIFYWLTQSGQ